jgi:hypothetical protein
MQNVCQLSTQLKVRKNGVKHLFKGIIPLLGCQFGIFICQLVLAVVQPVKIL